MAKDTEGQSGVTPVGTPGNPAGTPGSMPALHGVQQTRQENKGQVTQPEPGDTQSSPPPGGQQVQSGAQSLRPAPADEGNPGTVVTSVEQPMMPNPGTVPSGPVIRNPNPSGPATMMGQKASTRQVQEPKVDGGQQSRKDKMLFALKDVLEVFNLDRAEEEEKGPDGKADDSRVICLTNGNVLIQLSDGTIDKPFVMLAAYKSGSTGVQQIATDRENFEFSNAAGFARATTALLERNKNVLGLKPKDKIE